MSGSPKIMFDSISIETLREYSWLGYAILLFGMAFEGETIMMLIAAASRFGILSPFFVWFFAILGVIAGDIFWFMVGAKLGTRLLSKYGKILFISEPRVSALKSYLDRSPRRTGVFIILAKYLYGFAHLTLVTLGASRLPLRTFIKYTIPAAIFWVSVFFFLGYVYAQAVETLRNSLPEAAGGFIVLVLIIAASAKFFGNHFEKKHLKL